jgi:hypothetical protein
MLRAKRPLRAALVGEVEDSLRTTLADVLADLEIEVDAGDWSAPGPDLVLAILGRHDADEVAAAARIRAEGMPVVAILPFTDEATADRVLAFGVTATHALDTPMRRLKSILIAVLVERLEARWRAN